ncbi:MAG: cytochrome P450, partial [Bacteroidetes bacterium]|nr:cytochrome P450 [Bacteroidota bacterium]
MVIPNIKGNLLLELYNFANTPIDFLRQQFERNGNQFKVTILNRNIICTRNPIWLNHVFVKKQKNYTKDFTMKQIEFILGKGLLTNTGESWLQQRRLIQTAFHKGRLESLAEIMETIIESHITKLQKMPSGTKF